MRERIYLLGTYVKLCRFVSFDGKVSAKKRRWGRHERVQLLDVWLRYPEFKWIVFEYTGRFYAMRGSDVGADLEARLFVFVNDCLIFDEFDSAIAAAVLS